MQIGGNINRLQFINQLGDEYVLRRKNTKEPDGQGGYIDDERPEKLVKGYVKKLSGGEDKDIDGPTLKAEAEYVFYPEENIDIKKGDIIELEDTLEGIVVKVQPSSTGQGPIKAFLRENQSR